MELWVALLGIYDETTVVGVAGSEEEANDLVREAHWNKHPDVSRDLDPLDRYDTGFVDGPFELGRLRLCKHGRIDCAKSECLS